jgi:hypothetical protein
MTTPLNLYATKVFSEQPIALWSLDDTTDYIALLSQTNQNLNTWSVSGGTVGGTFAEQPPTPPFKTITNNRVLETTGNSGTITFTSPVALSESDINRELGSFAIGAYFFTYDKTVNVRLGYETSTTELIREVVVPAERQWAFVSQTFNLPEDITDLRFIVEVSFEETETPYELAINGINIGQWAEEFHLESLGVTPEPLPSNINIDSDAIPALPYGLDGANGYYLSRNNKLYAKNSGLPLVYGAFNSTVLFPHTNRPSLIIPGFGFMNKSGQYKSFTMEFWIKIQNNSFSPKRVFGPIASEDGLYVDGPFLKLKIGENIAAHYIAEWDRPMLIDIRIKPENASLIVNGEEVLSFDIDESSIDYPEKFDVSSNDQDWLGFYAYDTVPIIQIDCVGIYPYEVAALVAKRRWVYGQGVDVPNNLQGSSNSESVFIDYSFANYAKNYSYPRMGTWRNGVVENLVPEKQSLSLPDYTLPRISFDNQSLDQWYFDIANAQTLIGNKFIKLKPDSGWDNTNGYILFENLNLLQDDTKAFYGIFEIEEHSPDRQILFELVNDLKGAKLTLSLEKKITVVEDVTYEDYVINYTLSYKSFTGETIESVVYYSINHQVNDIFFVGLHLPRFTSYFGQAINSFFGAKQNIKVFVGGNASYTDTFKGKIYRIGFSTARNLSKIEGLFNLWGVPTDYENPFDFYAIDGPYDGGAPDTDFWPQFLDGTDYPWDLPEPNADTHLASYTLIPKVELGTYKLDIGIDSYWEDYIPLSYFGKYVKDYAERSYFSLDFLQLNLDYPKFANFSDDKYDTTNSMVKTYITFQYTSAGSNQNIASFANTQSLSRFGVVRPGDEWINTRYEVLDDTIIYPPKGINFNSLSLNIHIEIGVDGIISNPLKISSLQVASQALGSSPNKIGTRFGSDLIPYKKSGVYSDYKVVDPFSIYKRSTPYLYLTGNSGIKIRDSFSTGSSRGISLPVNKNRNSFFKIGALQMAFRYDEDLFPESPAPVFEIQDKNRTIQFYLVGEKQNRQRGFLFAIDATTGRRYSSITYSIDGNSVKRPTINLKTWVVLGLSFTTALDFNQSVGAIRITNPILVTNFSYYQITEEDEAERFAFRKWYAVRSEPDNPLDWDYWDEGLWQEVLFLTEEEPKILDPTKIYKQFTGTDRVVIQDDSVLNLGSYRYNTFIDVRWSRQILDSA